MRKMIAKLGWFAGILAAALAAFPFVASAVTINVCARYNNANYTTYKPTNYTTIQLFQPGSDGTVGTSDDTNVFVTVQSSTVPYTMGLPSQAVDSNGCTIFAYDLAPGTYYAKGRKHIVLPGGAPYTTIDAEGLSNGFGVTGSANEDLSYTVVLDKVINYSYGGGSQFVDYVQPSGPHARFFFSDIAPYIKTVGGVSKVAKWTLAGNFPVKVEALMQGQVVGTSNMNTGINGYIDIFWGSGKSYRFTASRTFQIPGESPTRYGKVSRAAGPMTFTSKPTNGPSATYFLDKFSVQSAP